VLMDVSNDQFVETGEKESVDFGSTDHEEAGVQEFESAESVRVVNHFDSLVPPVGIAGENDILAVGKRAADGVEGLSPHHDGMAGGGLFEKTQIFGKVPGETTVFPDDAVWGHGDNGGESHTATGALM